MQYWTTLADKRKTNEQREKKAAFQNMDILYSVE